MRTNLKFLVAMGGVVSIAASSSAIGTLLNPGDPTIALSGESINLSNYTLIDYSLTSNFQGFDSDIPPSIWFQGDFQTAVLEDNFDHTLTFIYQVHCDWANEPGTVAANYVKRTTNQSFTGFKTWVGYINDPASTLSITNGLKSFNAWSYVPPAGNPPHTADRSSTAVVGFDFNTAGDPGLATGDTTNVYFIRTNAYQYKRGSTQFIDGGIATLPSFAPASGVPGPAALLPFGIGLASAFMRRRKK